MIPLVVSNCLNLTVSWCLEALFHMGSWSEHECTVPMCKTCAYILFICNIYIYSFMYTEIYMHINIYYHVIHVDLIIVVHYILCCIAVSA